MGKHWSFPLAISTLVICAFSALGCGGGQLSASTQSNPLPPPLPTATPTPTPGGTPVPSPSPSPTPNTLPAVDHVFLVLLENHGFAQVIGSPSMPYLNSLASQHGLATEYFADTHPSIGNYFMLTAGNIETNNDAFSGTVTDDNLVRALLAGGKTWKAYMQSLPSPGYLGGDVYPYFKHHNPFAYFSDVVNSGVQAANIVPFSQLPADVTAATAPHFAFVAPDAENDAHDCPTGGSLCADSAKLAAADAWLKANLDPLITNPALANSVFIVLFDEALDVDLTHGGGRVATVIVGAHVKPAFASTALYQHENTLRLILDLLRVADHPGLSANASSMQEFFQ
jgi:phosphatidylinositol-3-phosphatase